MKNWNSVSKALNWFSIFKTLFSLFELSLFKDISLLFLFSKDFTIIFVEMFFTKSKKIFNARRNHLP